MSRSITRRVDAYVVTAPGLEPVTAGELEQLGIRVHRQGRGGVSCSLTWSELLLAHLWLRTATRVLVRIARFPARGFDELTAGLDGIDWPAWLPAGSTVEVRAAATASRLYHSGAIAERVAARLAVPPAAGAGPDQVVHVRVAHDVVTVSLDATGPALHRRGWRAEAGRAPMRETLAAALVLWSGWGRRDGLLDPCCGAGTIVVEAAAIAGRRAPGRDRRFTCLEWPAVPEGRWERLVAAADADVRAATRGRPLVGQDRDPVAVAVARANAERAGVADAVAFEVVDAMADPAPAPVVVTNPPYGRRLGGDVRPLYGAIGRRAGRLTVVAPAGGPVGAFGRAWESELDTVNGGVAVRFLRAAPLASPG